MEECHELMIYGPFLKYKYKNIYCMFIRYKKREF